MIKETLRAYLSDINAVVEIMREEGIRRNPDESWQRTLYQTGEVETQNLRYQFHGIGCLVHWGNKVIDFDFRGDEKKGIWGIDTWFAANYFKSLNIAEFLDVDQSQQMILKELQELESKGEVIKDDIVFFFKDDHAKLNHIFA